MRIASIARVALAILILFPETIGPVWATGGSEAGNGGGLSEKNLLFAYAHLPEYIDLCLRTPLCRVDQEEAELLGKIRQVLPAERRVDLLFRSGMAAPGFFLLDGAVRVAKTGDKVGSPIYVNSDLLYPERKDLSPEAIDVPLSTSILLHELGHHQGVKDHNALDRLGAKVQAMLLVHSPRAEFWNGRAALVTYQFNSVRSDADKKALRFKDHLVLENGGDLYDLGTRLAEHVVCPVRGVKPIGLRLYNVHEERGVSFDESTRLLRKPVVAWYISSCRKGEESDHGDLLLTLVFRKRRDGTFEFLPGRFKVAQRSCSRFPGACR